MQRLLTTTALIAALAAGGAFAQTATQPAEPATQGAGAATMPEITAPEGFIRQDVVLTAEDLLSATIYDANGDSVGSVEDLVFASADAEAGGMTGTTTGADATTGTGAATGTDGMAGTGADMNAATGTGADNGNGAGAEADIGTSAETDVTGTADGTSDAIGRTVPGADQTDSGGTGTGMPGDGTDAATGTGPTDTTTEGQQATVATQLTHAVIDVGGFLGIGQRRVAVPIEDLVVYRSDDTTRIYLPWTEDQLTQIPAYDRDDPATLSAPVGGTAAP